MPKFQGRFCWVAHIFVIVPLMFAWILGRFCWVSHSFVTVPSMLILPALATERLGGILFYLCPSFPLYICPSERPIMGILLFRITPSTVRMLGSLLCYLFVYILKVCMWSEFWFLSSLQRNIFFIWIWHEILTCEMHVSNFCMCIQFLSLPDGVKKQDKGMLFPPSAATASTMY